MFSGFYKITSSKKYNAEKMKFILLIKTHLPTTLISHWHFSTDQSKLTFENLVIGDVACLQLYFTQPCSERAYYLSYFINICIYGGGERERERERERESEQYMGARRYGISLLVFNSISLYNKSPKLMESRMEENKSNQHNSERKPKRW